MVDRFFWRHDLARNVAVLSIDPLPNLPAMDGSIPGALKAELDVRGSNLEHSHLDRAFAIVGFSHRHGVATLSRKHQHARSPFLNSPDWFAGIPRLR